MNNIVSCPSFCLSHNASIPDVLPQSFSRSFCATATCFVHPYISKTNWSSGFPFSTTYHYQGTGRGRGRGRGCVYAIKSDDAVNSPAKSLRRLLNSPGIHLGPACFDALSAKLVERAGLDFCFTTGLCLFALDRGLSLTVRN